MGLRPEDAVLHPDASEALRRLEAARDPDSRGIARRVHSLRPILLTDCLHGEVVVKSAIPRSLSAGMGADDLYVEDLPAFWRLLYTISRQGPRRFVVILAIVDHATYSRWFPGRGH